jgi:nitrogen regulatory protein PII
MKEMKELLDVGDYWEDLKQRITNQEVKLSNFLDIVTKTMEVVEKAKVPGSDKKDLALELLELVRKEYLVGYIDDKTLKIIFSDEMLSDTIDIVKYVAKGKTMLTEKKSRWGPLLTSCCAKK